MIGSSDDETNLTNELLLTNAQVWRLRKTFANSLSANIIRRRLAPLLKTGLCLMKNVLKLSAKRVL